MAQKPGSRQRSSSGFIVFENFEKMNTQSIRQGLPEKQLAWLENLQPISENNLTTVPGPGATLATISESIFSEFYADIGGVDYIISFTAAGAGFAINLSNGSVNQFAVDGTFSNPDVTTWQASRVLINDATAGYSTFDGSTFVQQGGVSPVFTVTAPGAYGSPPTITISGGSGSGATAVAIMSGSSVVGIMLTNAGVGYKVNDSLTVSFSNPPGTGATGHVTMTGYQLTNITISDAGTFTSPTAGTVALSISGGGGVGAAGTATIVAVGSGFVVQSAAVTAAGSGYTSTPSISLATSGGAPAFTAGLSAGEVISIGIDNPGAFSSPMSGSYALNISSPGGGAGHVQATANANVVSAGSGMFYVQSISIVNPGLGYASPPTVSLSTTSDQPVFNGFFGNQSVASIVLGAGGNGYLAPPAVSITGGGGSPIATAHSTLSGTSVNTLVLDTPGNNYTSTPSVVIGSTAATATAHVWPFVPKGTTLAVFQGRVWLGGGQLLQYTGTQGFDDFASANASGSLTISDSDLIHAIEALRSYNNYLYIVGDQSIKQIGNISLNAAGTVTLFSILTLSSDQGSIYKRSCVSFNRVFMFANANGVYAVLGSSVQKISDDMDGIWKLIDFSQEPQASVADIGAIHNVMYLVRYKDPLSTTRSILLTFNGKKWFVVSQGNSLKALATAAFVSTGKTQPYGSSGPDLTPLLADSTKAVPFRWQSALTHHGNPVQIKTVIRAGFAAIAAAKANVVMTVDTEIASQTYTMTVLPGFNSIGGANDAVNKPIGASGKYLGISISGSLANFTMTLGACEYQEQALWRK